MGTGRIGRVYGYWPLSIAHWNKVKKTKRRGTMAPIAIGTTNNKED